MNTKTVLAFAICCLPMTAVTLKAHAEIGKLTIDGVDIPENLYNGFYKGDQWCPPTSDTRYRDRLIDTALIVFPGRQGNFELSASEQKRIAEKTSELERAESGNNAVSIAKAAWNLFSAESSAYGAHLYPAVSTLFSRQDVLNEYKRLINIKDPRLTDVVIGKYVQLAFPNNEMAKTAINLFNSGKSLAEVTSAIGEHKLFAHNKDNWFVVDEIPGFSGDSHLVESGSAVFASEGQSWYGSEEKFVLYLDEVRELSRLRPFTEYNNRDEYAYDIARYDLWGSAHDARRLERWKNADIRENGEPVVMLDQYPQCP